MCRGKLRSRVLTPNAGSVKNYMKRLDNRVSRRDASLCRRAGFSIDRTACIDGRDKRLRPPGRPARSQSTARVSGTDTSFPRPLRPSSERLHLWKKVMKVHQDRQLRVCTHAQAQIQCRYAYLPKIGRHQNQTRSAGRSSPPVVDLYRQTHLARSELLRTPRHTSIYQGQFYP